MFAYCYS